jgi:outer membrane lipoprotein SlyB
MNTNTRNKPHALVWIAGIAVTAFSAVGIAAILGWIPTSMSRGEDAVVVKAEPAKQAIAKPAAPRPRADAPAAKVNAPAAPERVASAAPAVPAAPAVKAICAECGVVESIRTIDTKGDGSGIGAVGGAVVGGVAGNQIGDGSGRKIATVVGAVGGAVAGHQIEKYIKSSKSYEIVVRLENGSSQVVQESAAPAWRTGDRVKIVNGALQSNS